MVLSSTNFRSHLGSEAVQDHSRSRRILLETSSFATAGGEKARGFATCCFSSTSELLLEILFTCHRNLELAKRKFEIAVVGWIRDLRYVYQL